MARKRGGPGGAAERKVVTGGIKVTAVAKHTGPAATAVDVEVDPARLREEIGDYGRVKAVVAQLPGPGGKGGARSAPEPLHAAGSAPGAEHYCGTHLGQTDVGRGVQIEVETDAGTLQAQAPGESYRVSEEGQPAGSDRGPARR